MIRKPFLTLCALFFLLFQISAASGGDVCDLGKVGATYSIVEKDALEELKSVISRKQAFLEAQRKAALHSAFYHLHCNVHVPSAKVTASHLVDLTYTLPYDIVGADGTVIYPKGYTFNVLEKVKYRSVLVIVDATDKRQMRWLLSFLGEANASAGGKEKQLRQPKETTRGKRAGEAAVEVQSKIGCAAPVKVLITEGDLADVYRLAAKFDSKGRSGTAGVVAYCAPQKLIEIFGITGVPAIVKQQGHYLRVDQIHLKMEE